MTLPLPCDRRMVLRGIVAAAVLLARAPCETPAAEKAPAARPNVLLVCVDDLKPLLGCYGAAVIRSPNIDRLAARGVRFERAYCNQAVCAPSRNSLLTGLRPETIGVYDLGTNFRRALPQAVTLAQHFRRHGYRTEAVGKIFHVGHGNHEDPASWSVPHVQKATVDYALPHNQRLLTREAAMFGNVAGQPIATLPRGAATEAAPVGDDAYADGQIAAEVVRRLAAARAAPDEPWFLAVGFLKPHLPFCAPQRYWDLYDPAAFQPPAIATPPADAPPCAATHWGELRNYSDIPQVGPVDDATARHLVHGYHAAVSYMDAQLGRVLDALDAHGHARNTIVLLWGDHGWHLGDHGFWCKHTNYEQAARIPLILAAPQSGGAPGASSALVETVDIYPTLCQLAGLPIPAGLDGTSFARVTTHRPQPAKEAVFHVFPRGPLLGRAVRTARYRLVEWKKIAAAAETALVELYDYQDDPLETRNLAAQRPETVAELRALLARQPQPRPQIRPGPPVKPPPADRKPPGG